MSDNGETFKTNGAPPIPRPIVDEVEEPVEQESLPELDVSDFQEMDNNVTLSEEEKCEKRVIIRKLHSYYLTFPNECGLRKGAITNNSEPP